MLRGGEQYGDGKTCPRVHARSDDLPTVVDPVGVREHVVTQGVIVRDQTIQIVRLVVDPYRGHFGAVLVDSHADNQTPVQSCRTQRCQSDLSIAAAAALLRHHDSSAALVRRIRRERMPTRGFDCDG
jgi:hypothetical protein